ncbi:MAG TPA: acylphosphatase [bacterium]|nr:acylphosphatase [bacterium]
MQLKAQIRGRVQGVFYRAWTQARARELGLTGWVRNLPDGGVEWLAQGQRESLLELERLCHRGPPAAQVDAVTSEWIDDEEDWHDFRIEH